MLNYTVWVDGSIKNNGRPNAVSASVSLISKHIENDRTDQRFLVSYRRGRTTSNRAEMIAAIQALEYIKWKARFVIYSDSEYLVKGFNEHLSKWVENNWENSNGLPVANKDLWNALQQLRDHHDICMIHISGHAGHTENEVVDQLAKKIMRNPEDFHDRYMYLEKKLVFL